MSAGGNNLMIRIRGFARKTRRSTKGGSLSDSTAENSARNSHSDHDQQTGFTMGNNGSSNGNGNGSNGNGTELHRNGTGDATATARSRGADMVAHNRTGRDDPLANYLHEV